MRSPQHSSPHVLSLSLLSVGSALLMSLSGCLPDATVSQGHRVGDDLGAIFVTELIDAEVFNELDMTTGVDPCDPNPCSAGVLCVVEGGEATCSTPTCDDLRCPNDHECLPAPEGSDEGARCVPSGCLNDEGCPLEEHCDTSTLSPLGQGACVPDLCAPNERRCVEGADDAQQVEVCDPSGRSFEPLYTYDLERSACLELEGSAGEASAACGCEERWDCPPHMRCEQGVCRGRAEPPTCLLPPTPFEASLPTPEWVWGGAPNVAPAQARAEGSPFSESVQVVMTPLVVNLNDDTGDGVVDERDSPDVLFMSFCQSDFTTNGALRAVHGGGARRGQDLWARLGPYLWREGEPLPNTDSYRCSEGDLDPTSAIAAADLDDPATTDGHVEVVALHERDGLMVYSNEGELLLEALVGELPSVGPNPSISIANLDNEGMAEVVIANLVISLQRDPQSGTLSVKRLWRGSGALGRNGQGGVSCVADLDDPATTDGRAEVIAGAMVYELPRAPRGVIDPQECAVNGGTFETQDREEDAWCRGLLLTRWDATAVNEGLANREGFCAVADVWGADPSLPPSPLNPLDERPEVVVISSGELLILNGQTGALLLRERYGAGSDRGGAPNVDDFDGDGFPEVGSAFARGYVMMDLQPPTLLCPAWEQVIEDGDAEARAALPPRTPGSEQCTDSSECAEGEGVCVSGRCVCLHNGWRRATEDDSSKVTGSTLFDFNGDGASEVIYNDECFFRIYDGRDGRTLFKDASESRTRIEHPIVADVDNDGNAEIIFSTSTESGFCGVRNQNNEQGTPHRELYNPGVEVWGDPQDRWVPARRVWSQHAYHVTHITEGGAVPLYEPAGWVAREDARPYNSYRSQPRAFGIAPDLQVETLRANLDASCGGGGAVSVSLSLINTGEVRVGEGVRVVFEGEWGGMRYILSDPQGEPLALRTSAGLDPEARLPLSLSYDSRLDPALPAELSNTPPEALWAIVDVEEGSDFGRERECDEDNNSARAPLTQSEGLAELSVRLLSAEAGLCPNVTLELEVSNEGALLAELVSLALYAGNPLAGGSRLDTLTLQAPLPAQSTQVITWESERMPSGREVTLWLAIDPNNITPECVEDNNLTSSPAPLACEVTDR